MATLRSNAFNTLTLNFLSNAIGIFIGIITARLLGVEGKGIWAVLLASSGLMTTTLGMGFNKGIIQKIPRTQDKEGLLFAILSILTIGYAVVSIIVFSLKNLNGLLISFLVPETIQTNFFVLYVLLIAYQGTIINVFIGYLFGIGKVSIANTLSFLTVCISFLVFGVLFLLNTYTDLTLSFELIFKTNLITSICGFSIWVGYLMAKRYLQFKQFEWQSLKETWYYSLSFLIGSILTFLKSKVDFWIVFNLLSSFELGIYSVAANVAASIFLLSDSLYNLFYAHFANEKREDLAVLQTVRIFKILLIAILFCSIFVSLAGSILLPFFYGEPFAPSVLPFNILLVGNAIFSISIAFSSFFAGKKKNRINLYVSSCQLFLIVISNLVVYQFLTVKIAATINSLSSVVVLGLLMIYFLKETKASLSLFVLKRSDLIDFYNLVLNRHRGS